MANVLEMDLTGQLPANRITEDIKLNRQNKTLRLSKGSFYTKSLRVVNKSNQALLALGKDYRLGELDIEAVRFTPQHEICKEIIILNTSLDEITITYQAVGGEFQFNSITLAAMLQEYFETIGNPTITNTPDQYAPSKHIQNINDFMKLGGIKTAIDRIEAAIRNGKSAPLIAAMLAYVEELGNALSEDVKKQANELLEQVQFLKRRNEYRDGRYYLTSRSGNPGSEKGGTWTLDSNVLLYGANGANDVGQLVSVGEGNGFTATLRHHWRRSDTGTIIIYELTSSANEIDEGQSVTISLKVTGLAKGAIVPWKITGVDADDIVGGKLTGNFVLDDNGMATLVVQTIADRKTEDKEVMRLALVNAPTNYINVGINDTSRSPVYNVWFSSDAAGNQVITSINEGSEGYIHLGGNDLNEGERLYILQEGSTTTSADFDIQLPQYLDISAGKASAKFKLRNDDVTEGTEVIVVNICTTNNINSRVVRNSLNVIDTSRASVYRSRFTADAAGTGVSLNQANEGTVIYLVIEGENLKEGTNLQIQYAGQVDANDFVNIRPTNAQISNGKAIVQYSLKNDMRTEGNESFIVNVLSGGTVVTSSAITIIDTSITRDYDIYFSSSSAGADRITSVNEGDVCYLIIKTVGVADGTSLTLGYSGSATPADFMNTRPTSVQVSGGLAIVNYAVTNDRTSEGTELFAVTLTNVDSQPMASINILDTSVSPVINTKFSSNDRGTDVITNTPEGRSVYLIIQTSNMLDGEILNIAYGGTANWLDLDNAAPNQVAINNNLGVVEYKIKADALEEGTERLEVTVSYPNRPISSSVGIDILDTSKPPRLELTVFIEGQQVTDLNNLVAYVGQNVEVRITDVNRTLADNAIIYFNWNEKIAPKPYTLTNRIVGSLPSQVQMSNWVARFTFTYGAEVVGVESFTPLAFGLSATEAAGSGAQTNTFKYVAVKLALLPVTGYYSLTDYGEPITGQINGVNPIYYVVKSAQAKDGVNGSVKVTVDGVDATVGNGILLRSFAPGAIFLNGKTSTRLDVNPNYFDGAKTLSSVMTNNSFTTTVPNSAVDTVLLAPPITSIPIDGVAYAVETYNGKTYNVIDGINAYDYFVAKMGREPRVKENVEFTIAADKAVVGTETIRTAIEYDIRWKDAGRLTVINRGLLLGRGGDGNWYVQIPGNNGYLTRRPGAGNIIRTLLGIPVYLTNYGTASAGGNEGIRQYYEQYGVPQGGGGGAPYGKGGLNYQYGTWSSQSGVILFDYVPGEIYPDNRYGVHRGQDATFLVPGQPGIQGPTGNLTARGSEGGKWGEKGGDTHSAQAPAATRAFEGSVHYQNLEGGVILGRVEY